MRSITRGVRDADAPTRPPLTRRQSSTGRYMEATTYGCPVVTHYLIVPFDTVLLPLGHDPIEAARDFARAEGIEIPEDAVGTVLDAESPAMYRVGFTWPDLARSGLGTDD